MYNKPLFPDFVKIPTMPDYMIATKIIDAKKAEAEFIYRIVSSISDAMYILAQAGVKPEYATYKSLYSTFISIDRSDGLSFTYGLDSHAREAIRQFLDLQSQASGFTAGGSIICILIIVALSSTWSVCTI